MVTLTAPPEVSNVIVALAVSLGLLSDAAVSVTVVFPGGVAGAVYVAEVFDAPESVPQPGAQLLPDWLSVQDTPRLEGSLVTLAENPCVADGFSATLVGEIATESGGVMVIFAEALFDMFEMAVAVKVIVAGLGTLAGAT